jgi:hypothetical protein
MILKLVKERYETAACKRILFIILQLVKEYYDTAGCERML